tara:strand:- start:7779 stop:8240 length:462 start_codon:yes stop_codon:yes gene_type:complete
VLKIATKAKYPSFMSLFIGRNFSLLLLIYESFLSWLHIYSPFGSKGFGPLSYERSRIIRKNSTMEIYVGNLPWSVSDQELADAFGAYGNVEKASIISDRDSGRSKGFGFVTMNDADEANKAIEAMNGSEMGGRNLKVNEARPREERPPRKDNW